MGEPIRDFKQLRVYRDAFDLAMEIFKISSGWPKPERYALTDQIRRSSRAVCSNVAEAWFKRRYPKHFVSKLSDSSAEAAETLVWLDFARASGYLKKNRHRDLETRYRKIIAGLVRMMDRPDQWCVAEELISYHSTP
ncbi:MAG: four helix bundle protein [Bacteroidetes bacterium]|jgi:four helix bundle protein|nr:four helix bundle protein [Bacteroidota bacterium]